MRKDEERLSSTLEECPIVARLFDVELEKMEITNPNFLSGKGTKSMEILVPVRILYPNHLGYVVNCEMDCQSIWHAIDNDSEEWEGIENVHIFDYTKNIDKDRCVVTIRMKAVVEFDVDNGGDE
jgi:hypothetical protein